MNHPKNKMKEKTNAKLFAPTDYWKLTSAQRDEICNGCGAKGILGLFIPNVILGVKITPACCIHDYMYQRGETFEDKQKADRIFFNNMIRLIEAKKSSAWLQRLRIWFAERYYRAVVRFGGTAFWDGKNNHEELGET